MLSQQVSRTVDVVILGAGPAGSACALALRELAGPDQPLSIVLVEREIFPRFKVCGGCLNGLAIGLLRRMRAEQLMDDVAAIPLTEWSAYRNHRCVTARLPTGWAVSRDRFDTAMLRLAKERGVEVVQPCIGELLSVDEHAAHVVVKSQTGESELVRCHHVVVATGLNSNSVSPWLPWQQTPMGLVGAGTIVEDSSGLYPAGIIHMACASSGYVGVTRLNSRQLDVAAALAVQASSERSTSGGRLSVSERIADIITSAGMPMLPQFAEAAWKGTPRLSRRRVVGDGRVLAVGDAAGYVEPFTGEGMAWGLATGYLAAEAILENSEGHYNTGERYRIRYEHSLRPRQWTCRLIAAMLRRSATRAVMFQALSLAPWLARPFVHALNRRLSIPSRMTLR